MFSRFNYYYLSSAVPATYDMAEGAEVRLWSDVSFVLNNNRIPFTKHIAYFNMGCEVTGFLNRWRHYKMNMTYIV